MSDTTPPPTGKRPTEQDHLAFQQRISDFVEDQNVLKDLESMEEKYLQDVQEFYGTYHSRTIAQNETEELLLQKRQRDLTQTRAVILQMITVRPNQSVK